MPHSGGLRRPSNWPGSGGVWLRPPNGENHHHTRMPRSEVGVVGEPDATVDIAGTVDAHCGNKAWERRARGDCVHQVHAGITVERDQLASVRVESHDEHLPVWPILTRQPGGDRCPPLFGPSLEDGVTLQPERADRALEIDG